MLSKRQIEIFMDFYAEPDKIITLKTVAEKYRISIRTAQSCISIIKEVAAQYEIELRSISSKGCLLHVTDDKKGDRFVNELAAEYTKHYFFDEQSSRVHYLLSRLLNDSSYIKSQDLADQMFISRSRMSDDLLIVKRILAKYHLTLLSKPYHGLLLEGDEMNKRQCLIKENLNFDETLFSSLSNTSNSHISKVKNLLIPILMKQHYHISDIALQNLIIHIATAVDRIQKGSMIQLNTLQLDDSYHHVMEIAKEIMEECHQIFSLPICEDEIRLLAINLHGKREYEDQQYISDEVNTLVFKGLSHIKQDYDIDFVNDIDLRIALALHIVPLLSRLKTNMTLKNIMTYEIKQNYTLAFDIASAFVNYAIPSYQEKLSDDELSYLALHFSYSLKNAQNSNASQKILLICSQKKSETILIQQKIKQWFTEIKDISVISTNEIQTADFDQYNAILSTDKKTTDAYPRAKLINYFLIEQDYKKIELALSGFHSTKDIIDKFDKDLFYYGDAKDKADIIQKLYKKAEKKYDLDEELLSSVLFHEKIANSCFNDLLAIPHPEKPITDKTFVVVGVLKQAIHWEENFDMRLVFLISIEKNNPKALQLWYYLSHLISNKEALLDIVEHPTYDHLIKVITEIYKDLF